MVDVFVPDEIDSVLYRNFSLVCVLLIYDEVDPDVIIACSEFPADDG